MLVRLFVIPAIIVVFCGCAMDFDKVAADKRLQPANFEKSQQSTALKKPLKLGIFIELETQDSPQDYYESWDWNQKERKIISSYADSLSKEGYLSEYFFISDENISIQEIDTVIREGIANKADAVLAIRGILKVNAYMNPAALLDPTIIGAIWLPGSGRDVMMLSRLDLWIISGGEPLITVKSDCIRKKNGPTLLISTEETVNEVKEESLRNLLMEFKKKFEGLKFN